ncbi:MAG: DUF6538 domain-containing protein [Pseudomonadota bacterium]
MAEHLFKRGQTWYVRLAVPRSLQEAVGRTEIQRTTGTRDLAEAKRRRHEILAGIHREIGLTVRAFRTDLKSPDGLAASVESIREEYLRGNIDHENAHVQADHVIEEHLNRNSLSMYDENVPEAAQRRVRAAYRTALDVDYRPLSQLVETYLKEYQGTVAVSTYRSRSRFLSEFVGWAGRSRTAEEVSRRVTGQYFAEVIQPKSLSVSSKRSMLSSLSAFWKWLIKRGFYEKQNPWSGFYSDARGKDGKTSDEVVRRPWLPSELARIELCPKDDIKYLTMKIAQYSGMRLEEIASLRKEDVLLEEGMFVVRKGKTANARRHVPIHPAIEALVKHWMERSGDKYLLPELKRGGPDKKRSHYLGKNDLGPWIRETISDHPGVVFHSLRNTFTTRAEQLGIPEPTVQLIIGHARQSLTYGLYSRDPGFELLRDAIRKIDFPEP